MSYTLTFIVIIGLIVLIALWQRKAIREAKERQRNIEEDIKQRAKARKEMKAWENIPKTRMDKPTKLPTVHKRALTVPKVVHPVSKLPKTSLKPSYPPPKREPVKPVEVAAVEPSRADDFLTGAMLGLVVNELFHDRPSGSVIRSEPMESGGGGSFAGGGAESSWDSSPSDSSSSYSSSSDSGSSDSGSSSSDNN